MLEILGQARVSTDIADADGRTINAACSAADSVAPFAPFAPILLARTMPKSALTIGAPLSLRKQMDRD
ncbi:MAG: hypothetical protein ABW048_05065, partial [Sphingobium sp.]